MNDETHTVEKCTSQDEAEGSIGENDSAAIVALHKRITDVRDDYGRIMGRMDELASSLAVSHAQVIHYRAILEHIAKIATTALAAKLPDDLNKR